MMDRRCGSPHGSGLQPPATYPPLTAIWRKTAVHAIPQSREPRGRSAGFALPAAIGAKVARPDEEVWVIVGDGGFQMTAAELSTCAQENLKVNVAIINNGYLGMVRQWQEFFYDKRYAATPMRNPDFVKLAEAHGLLGLRVDKRAGIEEAVATAREAERGSCVPIGPRLTAVSTAALARMDTRATVSCVSTNRSTFRT